ncbi:MAG: 3-dehydroquinate synthase [Candidatus Dormiibacterota bacterium]
MTAVRRIALVGLSGTGKTTIAPLIAERLGWSSVDLDEEIASSTGHPPGKIIANDGEPRFRDLELAALESALRRPGPLVIACGGGLIAQPAARRLLTELCTVVWLDAPDAVLFQRLGDGADRPMLGGDAASGIPMLRSSRARAHQSAHVRINADDTPAAVASRVLSALEGTVRVNLAERGYHIEVRPGALDDVVLHVPGGATRVALIADQAVSSVAERLVASLRSAGVATTVLELTGGESLKTWAAAGEMLERLGAAGLQRNDCVVALGGGTVGDLAGFVAAVYLRGIAWVNVPTTLLAMVDSAIGGKTGVNLAHGKNLAGAIWQPRAVICDPDVLATQDDRSFRSAFAEIVKYSMITGTPLARDLDSRLETLMKRDRDALTATVRECCGIKADIVSGDEREAGGRAVLNYGHTAGHAFEAAAGLGETLLHGEAVAVGMRVAGRLSIRKLGCPAGDIDWQDEMIVRCGLPMTLAFDTQRVLSFMRADKKTTADRLGWVLIDAKGHARPGQVVPDAEVLEALEAVRAR